MRAKTKNATNLNTRTNSVTQFRFFSQINGKPKHQQNHISQTNIFKDSFSPDDENRT